jgi:hypothetical protein
LALALVFVFTGCKGKPKFEESKLPLPPSVDSGVTEGQFVQTDYGFGFPFPAKWMYLGLPPDQEVDEVARFADTTREFIVRLCVRLLGPGQKFSAKDWADSLEEDLKNRQFKVKKRHPAQEWKTPDSGSWSAVPFRLTDRKGGEWKAEVWVLAKGDLVISAYATLPERTAETEKGRKLFKSLEGALSQIHWYTPIGPRGLTVERYELHHFTEKFCRALESRSAAKIGFYFDEMYPARVKWAEWYQKAASGNPKDQDLKAELSGLVINGDYASASFTLTREGKGDSKPERLERSFKLSKKEGSWKITAPLDKN